MTIDCKREAITNTRGTKMKTRIALIAICMMLIATAASANSFTFTDNAKYWPGWQNGTSDDNKDVIGVPDFTTGTVTYKNGNIMTGFSVNYTADSGYNSLTSGDLFINTNDDTTWDYVVDLSGRMGGRFNVYAFNADYSDTSAYVMSTGSGIREDHPTGAIVAGSPVDTVCWTGLKNVLFNHNLSTSISGLDIEFDVLTVAYTVSCANDVVFAGGMAKTPIPAAAWLLGSGLMGLIGLRRKYTA